MVGMPPCNLQHLKRWQTWDRQANSLSRGPPRLALRSQYSQSLSSFPKLGELKHSSTGFKRTPKPKGVSSLPKLPSVGQTSSNSVGGKSTASRSAKKPRWWSSNGRQEAPFSSEEWAMGTLSTLRETQRWYSSTPLTTPYAASQETSLDQTRDSASPHEPKPEKHALQHEVVEQAPHREVEQSLPDSSPTKAFTKVPSSRKDRKTSRGSASNSTDIFSFQGNGSIGSLLGLAELDNQDHDMPFIWKSVFGKVAHDGYLPCTSIHTALQLIGHSSLDVKHVDAAFKEQGKDSGKDSLTLQEFAIFVDLYEEMYEDELKVIFEKADINGDGTVNRQELGELIRDMDLKMFPQVVDEVFREVDEDRTGSLDMDEFREVVRILQQRQGFSRQEANDIVEVFKRFDKNKTGDVPTSDLGHLLTWLGYHPEENDLADLIPEIDQDKSGTISPLELPLFMRKYRELELEKAGHFFGTHDKDSSGSIELTEIEELLQGLGFPLSWSSMMGFLEETHLSRNAQRGLVFEDFWRLLAHIRSKEGFTVAGVKEHYFAWARYAIPPEHIKTKPHAVPIEERHDWHLPTWESGKALHWLGILHVTAQELQVLVDEVDVDHSQSLDFGEFSKIMRQLHTNMAYLVQRGFPPPDVDHAVAPKISLNGGEMMTIKRKLGVSVTDEQKDAVCEELEISPTGEVNFFQCLSIIEKMRGVQAKAMRETSGFTPKEVTQWRAKFDKFDVDESDTLQKEELDRMLSKVFAELDADQLKLISDDAHEHGMGGGGIDFSEFLSVMRKHTDREYQKNLKEEEQKQAEDQERLRKQREEELKEMKELFEMADSNGDKQLSKEEIYNMIGVLVDLSLTSTQQRLEQLLQEVDKDGNQSINFNEFQGLIKVLQEEDFAGINTKAEQMAEQEAELEDDSD